MPNYYVNKNAQPNGDHEVHEENKCSNPPNLENRKDLGWHVDCHSAIREAKKTYKKSNGCEDCCEPCHTT